MVSDEQERVALREGHAQGLDIISIKVTDGQMPSEKGRNIGSLESVYIGLGWVQILVGRRTQPQAFYIVSKDNHLSTACEIRLTSKKRRSGEATVREHIKRLNGILRKLTRSGFLPADFPSFDKHCSRAYSTLFRSILLNPCHVQFIHIIKSNFSLI